MNEIMYLRINMYVCMYVCMYVLYQYAQVCFELSLRAGDFLVGHVVAEAH